MAGSGAGLLRGFQHKRRLAYKVQTFTHGMLDEVASNNAWLNLGQGKWMELEGAVLAPYRPIYIFPLAFHD
jgi:hypothetical protein